MGGTVDSSLDDKEMRYLASLQSVWYISSKSRQRERAVFLG